MTLIGYWPLDDDSGPMTDYAGSNDGTVSGATLGGGTFLGRDATSFDGTDDYLDFGTGLVSTTDSFSVSIWVNFNSLTSDQRVFTTRSDVNTMLSQGRVASDSIELFSDGTNYQIGTVSTGTWTHLAYTYDESTTTLRGYIDGEETVSVSHEPTSASGNMTGIGADTGISGHYADMIAAEARLYHRALSAMEARTLYEAASFGSLTTQAEVV